MASAQGSSPQVDRHGWNSLENYLSIHENRLNEHSFLDPKKAHTISVQYHPFDGEIIVEISGDAYCQGDIVLEVGKYLETQEDSTGRIYLRGISYRYHAYFRGRHNILRYDNGHDFDEYHRHEYDMQDGKEIGRTIITRNQLPTLGEVLDELEEMYWRHMGK